MPCIDRFVVVECVVADVSEVESGEVCALMSECTVVPVLRIPVPGGAVDRFRRDGTVNGFVPRILVEQGFYRLVALIEVLGGEGFEDVR